MNKGMKSSVINSNLLYDFSSLKWIAIDPPVRDVSEVLECGLLYIIVLKGESEQDPVTLMGPPDERVKGFRSKTSPTSLTGVP